MNTYIALLRGINVGGNNLIKMADLRVSVESLGHQNVRTLLQSGNVVFQASVADAAELERELEQLLATHFGCPVAVFVRSIHAWQSIVRENPFPEMAKTDPAHLTVTFFGDPLNVESVDRVRQAIVGREKIRGVGREIYCIYPDGIGTSKVERTIGWKKLFADGTARNWNTIVKLFALAKENETD